MRQLLANISDLWKTLTGSQKSALGVALLILAALVVVMVSVASSPRYTQLYGNMTPEDANTVVKKLQEQHVKYRLLDGGATVEVPESQVATLRLALASENAPQGGNPGFELFDKTQMGLSEFGEQLNYLRALQGELARTIEQLQSVRSARVHLVLPQQRLYTSQEQKPTASVVLALRTTTPSPKEVKAITHLVASAVEGMDPGSVTVVDTMGNLLSDLPDLTDNTTNATQLQIQRDVESRAETRIQSMLDRALGPDRAIVRVNAKVNFDHRQVDQETYTPVATNLPQGVLESQHLVQENYNSGKGPANTVITNTPGIATNLGLVKPNPATGPAANSAPSTYSHVENTAQYRVSKETQHTEIVPGQIEKMTVALLVDQNVGADQITQLKKTVAAVAGLDLDPKLIDSEVAVQAITFDSKAAQADAKQAALDARRDMFMTIGKYALALLLVAGFLVMLVRIFRTAMVPVTAEMIPAPAGASPALLSDSASITPYPMLPPLPDAALDQYESAGSMPYLPHLSEELPAFEELPINALDPQRVAQVIKELMTEER